jgi:sugar O-acyltransferase (sialic acid O-acetyltransferase NeuD family)
MTVPLHPAADLVLLGAGGNVNDVLDIVDALTAAGQSVRIRGLLDDYREQGAKHLGLPVLGALNAARSIPDVLFVSTIRNESVHRKHPELVAALGLDRTRFASLVHPAAHVSTRTTIAHGVYVCAGASVASGVVLHDHCSVGPNATVGHDTQVNAFAVIAASAVISGGVRVGQGCYVGSGASVKQGVRLGRGSLVGLGAVVVADVDDGTVVVGSPARPLRRTVCMTGRDMNESASKFEGRSG